MWLGGEERSGHGCDIRKVLQTMQTMKMKSYHHIQVDENRDAVNIFQGPLQRSIAHRLLRSICNSLCVPFVHDKNAGRP